MIQIEDDVYEFLLRNTQEIGEPASTILRRFLPMNGNAAPKNGDVKPDKNKRLMDFIGSPAIVGSRTATKRYLLILGFVAKESPDEFAKLFLFPHGGRHRLYFARTKADIENSGTNTHPKPIPETKFWALTNTDTPRKRERLKTTLASLGYSKEAAGMASDTLK